MTFPCCQCPGHRCCAFPCHVLTWCVLSVVASSRFTRPSSFTYVIASLREWALNGAEENPPAPLPVQLEALQGFYTLRPRMPRGTYLAIPTLQMRRPKSRVLSFSLQETQPLRCGGTPESSVDAEPWLCQPRHPALCVTLTLSWIAHLAESNVGPDGCRTFSTLNPRQARRP